MSINNKKSIDISVLKKTLNYDPDTGVFTWKNNKYAGEYESVLVCKEGEKAGGVRPDGYSQISINGSRYLSHALAWAYVYNENVPNGETIDHIDGNRSNNRISNLRKATSAQNNQNLQKAKKSNKSSGILGVHWNKNGKNWRVRLKVNGEFKHIGVFKEIDDAVQARVNAEKLYFTHSPTRNY